LAPREFTRMSTTVSFTPQIKKSARQADQNTKVSTQDGTKGQAEAAPVAPQDGNSGSQNDQHCEVRTLSESVYSVRVYTDFVRVGSLRPSLFISSGLAHSVRGCSFRPGLFGFRPGLLTPSESFHFRPRLFKPVR
jgi:hypothetical protein